MTSACRSRDRASTPWPTTRRRTPWSATPDLNPSTAEKVKSPRQVSRAIFAGPDQAAYTGGKDGYLYRYDFADAKLTKTNMRLPAAPGRESWASMDTATALRLDPP